MVSSSGERFARASLSRVRVAVASTMAPGANLPAVSVMVTLARESQPMTVASVFELSYIKSAMTVLVDIFAPFISSNKLDFAVVAAAASALILASGSSLSAIAALPEAERLSPHHLIPQRRV